MIWAAIDIFICSKYEIVVDYLLLTVCPNSGEIISGDACICANQGESPQDGKCTCPTDQVVQNGVCAGKSYICY